MGKLTNNAHKYLSRRTFQKGALSVAAVLSLGGLPLRAAPKEVPKATPDALFHLNDQGIVHIFSGAGHTGPYGEMSPRDIVAEILGCTPDLCRLHMGENPEHLPALLGQFANHLSFTNTQTTARAAELLRDKRQGEFSLDGNRVYTLGQVSQATLEIMKTLPKTGIIIAVAEL